MKISTLIVPCIALVLYSACAKSDGTPETGSSGDFKIAYINGDTIMEHFKEFRTASESLKQKQMEAEESIQTKSAQLEKEVMAYQRKAQTGTMSRNEMEATERRLGAQQESLINERDQRTNDILEETQQINERLQKVVKDKLEILKKEEGYAIIFNYGEGGQILLVDPKYDVTKRVLEMLNDDPNATLQSDTLK